MPPPRRKLVSPEEARAFLKRAPELDSVLVFAHGCYPSRLPRSVPSKFTVPPDTAIVFITPPSFMYRHRKSQDWHPMLYEHGMVKRGNLSMGAIGRYASMYVPGDVIDNFKLSFGDEKVDFFGVERIPGDGAKFVPITRRCMLERFVTTHGPGVYFLASCRVGAFSPAKAAKLKALNLLARERFRPTTVSPTIRFVEYVRPDLPPERMRNLSKQLSAPLKKTGCEDRTALVAHVAKPRGVGVVALAKRLVGGIVHASRTLSRPRNATLRKNFDTPDAAAALRRYILRKSKAYGQKEHNRINRAFAARHPNVARESNIEYDTNMRAYLRYKSRKTIDPDTFLYNGTNFWYDARSDLNNTVATAAHAKAANATPKRRRRKKAQSFNAAAAAYYRTARRA